MCMLSMHQHRTFHLSPLSVGQDISSDAHASSAPRCRTPTASAAAQRAEAVRLGARAPRPVASLPPDGAPCQAATPEPLPKDPDTAFAERAKRTRKPHQGHSTIARPRGAGG